MPSLLIIDDDSSFIMAVKYALKGKFDCRTAQNTSEATILLQKEAFNIILLDIQMRTPREGLEMLPKLKALQEEADIIMSSGLTDFSTVREALTTGATDYLSKDFDPDELAIVLKRVIERRSLVRRKQQIDFEVVNEQQNKHAMIGQSAEITRLKQLIERARNSDANVVIFGETGTGKEVVARNLRNKNEDGSVSPFVAIDSSTIQSATAESRLFGHEKGAFTGADASTRGFFEEANGGVIYFDEVSNMPLEIQAKLLRVIQEQEITRLGSTRSIPLSFRVIAATNRDLEEMSKKGEFKYDLFQRLNVIPLRVPALRERKTDIPLLVEHFISRQKNRRKITFSEEANRALLEYDWPGNIRELSNVVSYVATMALEDEVQAADLPPHIWRPSRSKGTSASTLGEKGFYERVAAYEKKILEEAYTAHTGKMSQLALNLEMDRSHLYAKLKEFGIHAPAKRPDASE